MVAIATVPILVVMQQKKTIRRRDGIFPVHSTGRLNTRLNPDVSTSEARDDLQGVFGEVVKMTTVYLQGCLPMGCSYLAR